MHESRQSFVIFVLVAVLTGALAAQPVSVTIDAARTGQPITKLMFGGFMEPATTQVWAEMLADRKFFNAINSKPAPAPTGGLPLIARRLWSRSKSGVRSSAWKRQRHTASASRGSRCAPAGLTQGGC